MSGTPPRDNGETHRRFQTEPYKGLMDYRATTRFELEEQVDDYIIFTSLHGLDGDTLTVRITAQHVIIEGLVRFGGVTSSQRARYVHHVGALNVDTSDYEVFYSDSNRLMIRLKRKKPRAAP